MPGHTRWEDLKRARLDAMSEEEREHSAQVAEAMRAELDAEERRYWAERERTSGAAESDIPSTPS